MGDSTLAARYAYSELLCDTYGSTSTFLTGVSPTSWGKFFFTQNNLIPAGIKVISANIPFIFDTISEKNNIVIRSKFPSIFDEIAITPGTYTGPTLATELALQLNTLGDGLYTVTWNSETFRFTITGPGPFGLRMGDQSPKFMLGLNSGYNGADGSDVLVSPNAASPSGPLYLFLNSSILGPLIKCDSQDDTRTINQICKIPIDVQKGGFISYKDSNPTQFFDFPSNKVVTFFDLYLTLGYDQEQVPLDMKGMGFSVVLGVLGHRKGGLPITQRPGPINFLRG